MKKVRLKNNVIVIGYKNFSRSDKTIDYYLITHEKERIYAFSGRYTHRTYNICKSGIPVNDLAGKRSRGKATMHLVKQINRMIPYLAEVYELPLSA